MLLGLVLIPARDTTAQESRGMHHVITIEPGRVLIDGKEVADNDLPDSFDLSNITTTLNLTGHSIIELNGIMFQLQDGKIVEAGGGKKSFYDVMVYFTSTSAPEQSVRILSPRSTYSRRIVSGDGPYDVLMKNYVGKLKEKAVEFEKIHSKMSMNTQNIEDNLLLAEQLRMEAENTARIAGDFPRVEYEGYLRSINEKDSMLYNRLVEENILEMKTHELAMQARSATEPVERKKFAGELRIQLEEIFELKQQNREDEINQLSVRLQDLTGLMDKRATLRDRIIESRLKELLGELDW